jgi:hypothetical protein
MTERAAGAGPAIVGFVVFAAALWAQSDALVGVFYDDGIYIVGAKALAEGQGYRNIHLPDPLPMVHFPFLYPVALSLLWRLWPAFPQNTALFELFDAVALGMAAWVVAAQARRMDLPPWVAWTVTGLGFTVFPLLTIVGVRFSEPLFLALAVGAVSVVDRERPTARSAALAGLLAGLATLARSIGVAVAAGVAVGFLVRREWRLGALAAAVAAAAMLPWVLWVASHPPVADPALAPNYGTYLSEARQAGIRAMVEGLDGRALGALGRLALPPLPGPMGLAARALLLMGVVFGVVRSFRRAPALVATVALYTVVVSLWPFHPDRFMWIAVPWFGLLLAAGCHVAWSRGRPGRLAVAVVMALLAWGFGLRQITSLSRRGFEATAEGISRSFRVLVGSIRDEIPGDAIVAVVDEALIYLYTGRATVPSYVFRWRGRGTEPLGPDDAAAFYCRAGVTHIALTGPAARTAPPVAGLLEPPEPTLLPLFQVTDGPSLHRFRCPG